MMQRPLSRAGLVVLLSVAWPSGIAVAQPTFDAAGARALGMGGAFVAVADDATATHWNGAGLATGGPAGMSVGWLRARFGHGEQFAEPGAWRTRGTFTSLGTWPLGISYGTFELTRLDASAEGLSVVTLRTSQIGATVLQTLVEGLVVGSTLRYVRGGVVSAASPGESISDAMSRTDDLEGDRSGAFDFDVSLMMDMRRARLGVTWKNLRSPTFGDVAETRITLPRQTRIGLAILPTDGLTLALDYDLETVDLLGDPQRMVAVGGEARVAPRLVVRSGTRWSVRGPRRLVGAAGLSVAIRPGLWLDGHYTQDRRREDRAFGVAIRAGR